MQGCSVWSLGDFWERTARTPVYEASTSTINCLEGSGWVSVGALVNSYLSLVKAESSSEVHFKGTAGEISWFSGATYRL